MSRGVDQVIVARMMGLLGLVCVVSWVAMLQMQLSDPAYGGEAVNIDFAIYWAAAKLALAEGPLAPFDLASLNAARGLPPDMTAIGLWLYPPGWLALILPLGLMGFFWAWVVFSVIQFAFLAAVLREPARAVPGGWLLTMASLPVLFTLAAGQNSLFFAALMVLSVEALRRSNAVLAGLAIACVSLKPHLGLALPVILLAGGHWRAILWAVAGVAVILALSLAWPGAEYWSHFLAGLREGSAEMGTSDLSRIMISGYATASRLGLGHDAALAVQGGLSLATLAGLAWLWQSRAAFGLKAAGLMAGVLLVTPYALHYETAFAAIALFYLARAGGLSDLPTLILAGLIWLTPVLGLLLLPWPGFLFAAPLFALLFLRILGNAQATRAAA